MFYVLQNESTAALRRVPILLTDAATGTTAMTGVAITNIHPYVNINGGSFAGGAGTVAEAGYGQYYYEFDLSEVATLGMAGIHVTATGCRDYDAISQVSAFNMYSGAGVGITAGDVWAYDISGVSGAGSAGTQLNIAASGGAGMTAFDVWNYTLLSTGDSADTTLGAAKTNAENASNNTGSSSIRDAVWDTDISYLNPSTQAGGILYSAASGATTAGSQVWSYVLSDTNTAEADLVSAASGGSGITAGDVWNFDVVGFGGTNSAAVALTGAYANAANTYNQLVNFTPTDIWTYSTGGGRTLTSGSGISAADVWNYTLLSSGQSADATLGNADDQATNAATNTNSPTLEANVWSYATRTLTSGGGITAGDVWSYGTRTITGGVIDTNNDKTGYSLSGTQSFNLTGNITGNLSGSVGSVTNAVSVATDSMSGIANTVWESTTAAHTTNGTFGKTVLRSDTANKTGDVTLYSSGGVNGVDADMHRIANDTAAATALKNALTGVGASWTGNITGNLIGSVNSVTTDVNVSTTSMSGIANTVWSAAQRTITGGTANTVTNVTNPVSVTTGSMSGIAGTVWNYVLSDTNTAEEDLVTVAAGGVGITAGDVWNYNIASITTSGSAGNQLNDAAVSGSVVTIVNGPYRVTSTAEGTDGIIDILKDSVQPITIYCINGFEQPFNLAGYTASVDIFDEAGGPVVSYVPTIDYSLGGILTFSIDTDVTGIIGRYTLVVSLTNGDVVQLGPLQILVRPL